MRRFLLLSVFPIALLCADPFSDLDADRSGGLSAAELPEALRPYFGLADADGDGQVARQEFERAVAVANTAAAQPEHLKDIDYAGAGNPRQKLDLLVQKDRTKKRPLVVVVHGGGWLSGRKEDGLDVVRAVVATGDYAAATINYRLSQEARWPAQIHDCKAAIRFLRAKAADYGIDSGRIGVIGFSAGGHLVSLLGTGNGEPALEGDIGPFAKVSSRVQCVVNFFGPTDFVSYLRPGGGRDKAQGEKMVAQLLGRNEEEIRRNAGIASPVTWVSKDDAPFFTAHGTGDSLVPFAQATAIHGALEKAGVESHLVAMEGAGHGFADLELNRRIRQFFDKHLRDIPAEISGDPIKVR